MNRKIEFLKNLMMLYQTSKLMSDDHEFKLIDERIELIKEIIKDLKEVQNGK